MVIKSLVKKYLKKTSFYIGIGLLVFFSGFPFLVMFFSSLKTEQQQYVFPPRLMPEGGITELTLENYANVMNPDIFPFFRFFGNSFLVASLSAGLAVIIAVFGAYSFARLKYTGRTFLRRSIILVYMFGGILLIVPLYQIVVSVNLDNTRIALIGVYLMQVLPVSLYMLGNYFRSVPYEIEEAAVSLGASRVYTFFRIVLPNISSGVIAAFVLAFINSFNNVPISVFLTGPGVSTLPIQMMSYVEYFFDPTIAALSVVLMLLTVIIMLIIERTLGIAYFTRNAKSGGQ